jgi:hypothetical protein
MLAPVINRIQIQVWLFCNGVGLPACTNLQECLCAMTHALRPLLFNDLQQRLPIFFKQPQFFTLDLTTSLLLRTPF